MRGDINRPPEYREPAGMVYIGEGQERMSKGRPPVPVKKIAQALAQEGQTVISTPEIGTSAYCAGNTGYEDQIFNQRTLPTAEPHEVVPVRRELSWCNHKKAKLRQHISKAGHLQKYCVPNEGETFAIRRTHDHLAGPGCPAKVPRGEKSIRRLKSCTGCISVHTGEPLIEHKDTKSGHVIRHVGDYFALSGTRPDWNISLQERDQEVVAEEEEDGVG
ncbi:hypothetical protein HK097_005346 [Rhizophlyctis rosea]|uniref:Uncharacterized protein n=1 Tax=Rhizophlyctis rosea TaxID=64517 RepID=A0AAD5SM95_9FUNG|nr:hypothetical protein HK097_005346 [Rhizophlyctis rosea]